MDVSGSRHHGSDDHSTYTLCDPCLGVGEEENAEFYCTVCNEYLCDADAKAHRKAAALKTHQLLSRDSMPSQKLTSYVDNVCSIHSGKVVKYYCNAHGNCCCSVCATIKHKQCNLKYIDEIAKEYERSPEYKSLEKSLADLTKVLQTTKEVSDKNRVDVQSIHAEFVSEVRKFRSEINTILDSLENTSLKEAQNIRDSDSKTIDSVNTKCGSLLTDIQEISSTTETLKKYNQKRQLVIYSKKARARVTEHESNTAELSHQNAIRKYKFRPNEQIRQSLQSLHSLGQLEDTDDRKRPAENVNTSKQVKGAEPLKSTPSRSVTASHVSDIDSNPSRSVTASHVSDIDSNPSRSVTASHVGNIESTPSRSVTASHVGDINIQHYTDTDAVGVWITGGVMIDTNRLVLVDCNNSSVKVVDVNNHTVISCLKLPTPPRDITCVTHDQAVVTCYSGKLVVLKVGKSLSILKALNIGGDIWGIVYTNNTLVVVFASPESCVKVMKLNGKILKTFKTDRAGGNLFKYPQYVTVSTDQKTLFVSDYLNHSVTSLDMDGTPQHLYTDDTLRSPRGLAVDRKDNVYIAAQDSHTIHQLSTECKPIQILLDSTHGMEYPQTVTYCKTGNRLYVGYANWGSKCNVVSVFQLH